MSRTGLRDAALRYLGACVVAGAVMLSATAAAWARDAAPTAEIRITGSPADAPLLQALQQGFNRQQPHVRFTQSLHGPESTLAGVYTGTADVAFMARELREPLERMAFEWVLLDKPQYIQIAHAGVRADRLSSQLALFVHKDNPVRQLTLPQIDAIFGAEPRGEAAPLRRWGQVGLDKDWRQRDIRVHGPKVDTIQALYFRRHAMGDSRKWNPGYREAASEGAAVIAAIANDGAGIGYAPVRDATAQVRVVPIAATDAGPFVVPDAHSVRNGQYPLIRSIGVVTAQTAKQPMAAPVRAFIDFLLSAEGQAIIAREGSYLPLHAAALAQQREALP
jgi:phosphate transport system substrate-binding protein